MSVSLANEHYSLPAGYRLYLPQDWAEDAERRHKARVPEELGFATKPQIAIKLLRGLKEADVLPPLAIADADYGVNAAFRRDLRALGMDSP